MCKKLTEKDFIDRSNKIHNFEYDYSLVNLIDCHKKVKIICQKHGIFEQIPSSHLLNHGCPHCRGTYNSSYTTEKFIKRAIAVHGNKFDYSLVKYKKSNIKIKIICQKHGIFEQTPNRHLSKCGCPLCRTSKGEKEIYKILKEKDINFIPQKKFIDCKYIRQLPFDFFLPEKNVCIEFDGEQHYSMNSYWGNTKDYDKIKIKDNIKTEYCRNKNIELIRIKFDDNIFEKLNLLKK